MHKTITLKKVIVVIKLSLLANWFWPLSNDADKRKVLCRKLFQCASMLIVIAGIIMSGYTFLDNLDDPETIVASGLGFFPSFHLLWNLLCHEYIYKRLQYVTFEMESFCELMKPHEETIVQNEYIDKYVNFYGLSIVAYYVSIIFTCVLRPIILHDPLPIAIDFPPNAYEEPQRTIIFMHQILVGLQVAANLSVNAYMALLLWLLSVKFRLLNDDLQQMMNLNDFIKCIKKHQELLEHAKEVTLTVRLFAMGSVISSTINLLICGLIIINESPLPLKLQCILLAISALSEVFMYAWPAEHLMHISDDIGITAFNTDWYSECIYFQKNLQIMIQRSQKSIIVSLPCGMSSLSLSYYATFLSTIFSYFTTLRLMFAEEENVI